MGEKYPDIPAPPDRTLVEAAFLRRTASTFDVAGRMPRLVGVDRAWRVLALEYCDGFTDLTGVYEGVTLHADVAAALLAYLAAWEFDYGILAPHVILADQHRGVLRLVASAAALAGANPALVAGFAGVEIMRRLIGVAQLPRLARSLEVKRGLLERSRRLVLGGSLEA